MNDGLVSEQNEKVATPAGMKFELVTMLRSAELLGARRSELFDLDGDNPRFDVPLKRVKKRRVR